MAGTTRTGGAGPSSRPERPGGVFREVAPVSAVVAPRDRARDQAAAADLALEAQ